MQAFQKKEQEIATWSNNMGFFSKSKNAEALLEELKAARMPVRRPAIAPAVKK